MITLLDVVPSIVSKLKDVVSVHVPLVSSVEVREFEWQGTDFTYPNIRVRINQLEYENTTCTKGKILGVILISSELPSSKQCMTISSQIIEQLHGKSFSYDSVLFTGVMCKQIAPDRSNEEEGDLWLSRIEFSAIVSSQ